VLSSVVTDTSGIVIEVVETGITDGVGAVELRGNGETAVTGRNVGMDLSAADATCCLRAIRILPLVELLTCHEPSVGRPT
jgi:hypothetical protein